LPSVLCADFRITSYSLDQTQQPQSGIDRGPLRVRFWQLTPLNDNSLSEVFSSRTVRVEAEAAAVMSDDPPNRHPAVYVSHHSTLTASDEYADAGLTHWYQDNFF